MPSHLTLHSDAYILVVDDSQVNVKLLLALSEGDGEEAALHASEGTRAAADVILDGTAPIPDA